MQVPKEAMVQMNSGDAEGFETTRLRVENWRPSLKGASSREVLTDELTAILTGNVMRHLPDALQVGQKRDAIAQWISDRDAEAEVLTVRDHKSSTLLGLMILAEIPDNVGSRSLHLGYLRMGQAETAWGQGYAMELVSGLVKHLTARKSVARVQGGVGTGNTASARVLEKVCFKKSEFLSNADTDVFVKEFPWRR